MACRWQEPLTAALSGVVATLYFCSGAGLAAVSQGTESVPNSAVTAASTSIPISIPDDGVRSPGETRVEPRSEPRQEPRAEFRAEPRVEPRGGPRAARRVEPRPERRVELRSQRLGIADVEHLALTRNGDRARVHRLKMRIPQSALVRFLAESIAGGPVQDLSMKALGAHRLALEARAFGWQTQANLGLSAVSGRARVDFESARVGWFPVSGRYLRDQIIASSDYQVIKSGEVRAEGASGLSFSPDYLFSHLLARLPYDLTERGLPPHLDVQLTDIALRQGYVRVEGGE